MAMNWIINTLVTCSKSAKKKVLLQVTGSVTHSVAPLSSISSWPLRAWVALEQQGARNTVSVTAGADSKSPTRSSLGLPRILLKTSKSEFHRNGTEDGDNCVYLMSRRPLGANAVLCACARVRKGRTLGLISLKRKTEAKWMRKQEIHVREVLLSSSSHPPTYNWYNPQNTLKYTMMPFCDSILENGAAAFSCSSRQQDILHMSWWNSGSCWYMCQCGALRPDGNKSLT